MTQKSQQKKRAKSLKNGQFSPIARLNGHACLKTGDLATLAMLQVFLTLCGDFQHSLHLGPDCKQLALVLGHHEGLHGGLWDDEAGAAPHHLSW